VTRIPAGERREALVQAALRVVAERGVAAATTRAIVAEAGMSLASFHYAFTSRDELMAELVAFVVDRQQRALAPLLTPSGAVGTLREAIRSGLEQYFGVLREFPQREKAMLELTQYALRAPEMQPLARRQYDSYRELAASALSSVAELTGDAWTRPVDEVARMLIVLTDGLTIAWLVDGDDAAAAATMDFAADAIARLAEPEQAPEHAPDHSPAHSRPHSRTER
jgi:Uncharacterized protein conserved in bacteria